MPDFIKRYQRNKRLKHLGASQHPDIIRFLKKDLPQSKVDVYDAEYLALDFETTGLNPRQHEILSIGYTVLDGNKILLGQSDHHVIRVQNQVSPQSATIHGMTDQDASQGKSLEEIMPGLLALLAGRFVLVHHAAIEKNFLAAACRKLYGFELPLEFVDTLQVERQILHRQNAVIQPNQLRLFNLRRAYGLPRYNAHNAMEDAIATAELFLAQTAKRLDNNPNLTVKDVMKIVA